MPLDDIDRIGAEVAALTHGHELGYIPAAALVHVISLAAHNDGMALLDAVLDMRRARGRSVRRGCRRPDRRIDGKSTAG